MTQLCPSAYLSQLLEGGRERQPPERGLEQVAAPRLTSLPLLRAPLVFQLGESGLEGHTVMGHFLQAAMCQRPGSQPWALSLDLVALSYLLEWPEGEGDDF